MNARGKHVDKTYLSIETAEERGFIHRDYIAHCLRWSHVIKVLQERKAYASARILDVGCGRELPLPTTLYSSRFTVEAYYGVDVGPINDDAVDRFHSGRFPLTVYENTDILGIQQSDLGDAPVNWVTCFEMLEHIEPAHMIQVLEHLKILVTPDARFFFSTPCWNERDCADNHVNEIKYQVLGAIFQRLGFRIKATHGTFASIRDYEGLLTTEQRTLFNDLRSYYDVNFLSCVFAPLFPSQARNVLWELALDGPEDAKNWGRLSDIPQPWGSSQHWDEVPQRYL